MDGELEKFCVTAAANTENLLSLMTSKKWIMKDSHSLIIEHFFLNNLCLPPAATAF